MIIRNILVTALFFTAASICKPQAYLGPLLLNGLSLKSIYHHFPHYGPTPNCFQLMQVDKPTQPSYYVQSEIGTAYRPSAVHMKQLFARREPDRLLLRTHEAAELHSIPYILPDVADQASATSYELWSQLL